MLNSFLSYGKLDIASRDTGWANAYNSKTKPISDKCYQSITQLIYLWPKMQRKFGVETTTLFFFHQKAQRTVLRS